MTAKLAWQKKPLMMGRTFSFLYLYFIIDFCSSQILKQLSDSSDTDEKSEAAEI